jgi:hypothetical protein
VTRDHLRAQAALVRMLYDPAFAAAVIAEPERALPTLPEALRRSLAGIDPRALRRDVHRRERTLGQLCEELPCSTTLVLAEQGKMGRLLAFFDGVHFHQAVEERQAMVLALGAYLEELFADGSLRWPETAAVLTLELASARARRGRDVAAPGRLRRATGVEPVEVPTGALAALQAVERHRFRLGLLPGWGQALDPPTPQRTPLGPGRATLAAIALDGAVSLVEIERSLHAVLTSLPEPRTRAAVLEEATRRLGGDASSAETALASLIDDELVLSG